MIYLMHHQESTVITTDFLKECQLQFLMTRANYIRIVIVITVTCLDVEHTHLRILSNSHIERCDSVFSWFTSIHFPMIRNLEVNPDQKLQFLLLRDKNLWSFEYHLYEHYHRECISIDTKWFGAKGFILTNHSAIDIPIIEM